MEISTLMELALSDESFKTVGLVILWQMRGEIKQMKDAIAALTVKMAKHEDEQDRRWSDHEFRLREIEKYRLSAVASSQNKEDRLKHLEEEKKIAE